MNPKLLIVITLLLCLLVVSIPAQAQNWTQTGSLGTGRTLPTANLLANGKVLVAGGCPIPCTNTTILTSAEIYDPETGQWTATGNMGIPRFNHVAVRLQNGKVLVTGGDRGMPSRNRTNSAELYDPATGIWTPTGSLGTARPFLGSRFSGPDFDCI